MFGAQLDANAQQRAKQQPLVSGTGYPQQPLVSGFSGTGPQGGAPTNSLPSTSAPQQQQPQRDRFSRLEKIGEGTYGVVHKCEDNTTGQLVALKRIRLENDDDGVPSTAIREVSILRELQHPNVVRLLDCVCQDRKLLLVFEHLEQDLKRLMDRRATPMIGRKLKCVMYQLLDGINACHSQRIVHRDLKPHNILVSRDESVVKLADFGLARAFQMSLQTYTHEVVTLWYRPPEVLLGGKHYFPSLDIWSLGCIMAEMATNKPLFPGDSEIHELFLIFQTFGTPTENIWPGVSDYVDFKSAFPQWKKKNLGDVVPTIDPMGIQLLQSMLTYDPKERVTARAALQHPWFDEVRGSQFNLVTAQQQGGGL